MIITKFENLKSDYDRVQSLKSQNLKLESEIKELKKRQMTPLLLENKKLKDEKDDLTNALKSSLSQTAYLVETIKTFDADFFKIKDFNNS